MAFNPITYIKESTDQLSKVVWPTRNETIRLTLVVIAASLAVGAYIAGLDALFTKLAETFLYR